MVHTMCLGDGQDHAAPAKEPRDSRLLQSLAVKAAQGGRGWLGLSVGI